jgi:hypothetical protein
MPERDLKLVIADLRKHKPHLFTPGNVQRPKSNVQGPADGGTTRRGEGSVMSARPGPASNQSAAEQAASQALVTGHRHDLLRYLRLRRSQ